MGKQACGSCAHLSSCRVVTPRKIVEQYKCDIWARASSAELDARFKVVTDFGLPALRFEIPAVKDKSVKKTRRRKRNV